MTAGPVMIPDAVYTIWWVGLLLLTLLVFVPLAVYSLHRTWHSARSIQQYAAEALAAAGIERNTRNVAALDHTIATATDVLGAAGAVERKLDTVAGVLEERRR